MKELKYLAWCTLITTVFITATAFVGGVRNGLSYFVLCGMFPIFLSMSVIIKK